MAHRGRRQMLTTAMTALAMCGAMMSCTPSTTATDEPNGTEAVEYSTCDTMTYTVPIKTTTPNDETEAENLRGMDSERLADAIFEALYGGKYTITDYQTGEELTLDEVKTREIDDERYSRDKVAALQFTEEWKVDTDGRMHKRVMTMHVAYEARDPEGNFVAYRAGIILKPKK